MSLEVWSFIVDLLSLGATVGLTIAIYKLQSNHEKEREKLEDEAKKQAIVEAAKVFLIDNDEEVEYLPLSVIAKKLAIKRKHCRVITTKFLRCRDELQSEILKQANFQDIDVSKQEIENALKLLEQDMKQHSFGRSVLYDDAKYFQRAIERYSDVVVENVNPYRIDNLRLSRWQEDDSLMLYKTVTCNSSLFHYMYDYLHPWEFGVDRSMLEPPIEMLWRQENLATCDEDTMTFWTMRIIIDSCRALTEAKDTFDFDELLIKTQEDMYYYTVLVLHNTYGSKETGVNNE